ncbi:hypothetical protein Aph02nite_37430 [Actinoplanes philippinensis]|uniref:Uncharacterized protein n=1 Tax=Actinoplanes philippinensis TaxID=35752 RepID=A0A1I2FJI5_9ACTN|nr:hypothetical protein [Actinoplanes philippinensis]GIE77793.1 hypothetical protein Aph02nite_37430 [Actinoplanes philippinensis]SFF05019.1 hypothetical protein SAMN05421541_105429 [Actinoplanes philippinensis]
MSEQAAGRFWSGIDVPKTIAGTLAAVSAAVLGSFLGVAGTLIGAALASLISSIGTEIYHRSINHGTKQLQSAFMIAPAAVGTPAVEAASEAAASETETAEDTGTKPERRIHWKRVVLVTGAFFLLGMGVLTTAELFAGRSAADVTSGRDTGSPTILFDTEDKHTEDEPEQKPAGTPSTAPETTTTETTAPATETTTAPAEPTPTTEGPTPTTPAGTGAPEQNETGGDTGAEQGQGPEQVADGTTGE